MGARRDGVFRRQSPGLNPDFLSEVVLYALSAADLTMVLALVFFLARNIVKLFVERRRGLPFSRFRAKLVMALLGLTIVPSVLVLLVGGELIRSGTQLWFSQPVDEVLSSAIEIGGDYYREHEGARRRPCGSGLPARSRRRLVSLATSKRAQDHCSGGDPGAPRLVEMYRVATGRRSAAPRGGGVAALPRGHVRALADRLATRVASGSCETADGRTTGRRRGTRPRRRGDPGRLEPPSASSSPALLFAATSRSTPGESRTPTRTTTSCMSFVVRSKACICRSS